MHWYILIKGMIGICLHSYVVDRACLPVEGNYIASAPTHNRTTLEKNIMLEAQLER